jgi:hypothetical protein
MASRICLRTRSWSTAIMSSGSIVLLLAVTAQGSPWAVAVDSFAPGTGGAPSYPDPNSSIGEPTRFTGVAFGFPSVVSMFSPAFDPGDIVSIGKGGQLTVRLGETVSNDPGHLYGVDLIVFGNAGFGDDQYPNGVNSNPAFLFGAGGANVEISADGQNFVPVAPLADSLFPTQGYLDSGPYDGAPGNVPSDFRRPMNPALSLSDFNGLNYAQSLALYDGSGGGTPIDIAGSGLGSVNYVRISVPLNAPGAAEIDAFAVVPEPGAGMALLGLLGVVSLRRPSRGKTGL